MRLDLFLKTSRLVLRRTVAQQLSEAGRIEVNGTTAKASKEIKVGDEIAIVRGEKRTVVRVLEIPNSKQVSKAAAATLVEVIGTQNIAGTLLS
jgi:ribosomal 50S subunit-recycling heat shock protein